MNISRMKEDILILILKLIWNGKQIYSHELSLWFLQQFYRNQIQQKPFCYELNYDHLYLMNIHLLLAEMDFIDFV